jgi:hypothetical protein
MKVKLNLTIEEELLSRVKRYAMAKGTSISGLVEEFFRKSVRPSKKKNILDLLDAVENHKIDSTRDLVKEYYQDRSKKYGS